MQNPKPNLYSMGMGGVSTYGPGSFGAGFTAGPGVKKSLNREKRRRELVKITQENQAFLKRLQQKSATYSVERWENQYSQQVKYRENVCENPYEFGDGLPKSRLLTAAGQGRGRLDYLTSGEGQLGQTALPRIGSQSVATRDQLGLGQYHTLNSQKALQGKRTIIK